MYLVAFGDPFLGPKNRDDQFYSLTAKQTCLISSAARYVVVEEGFMKEQGTFPQIASVVIVTATHQIKALQCTLAIGSVLDVVRCIRAAVATAPSSRVEHLT